MRARNNLGLDCCEAHGLIAGPDRDGFSPFVVTYHYNEPQPVIVWAETDYEALNTTPWRAFPCVRPATVADMADHAVALAQDEDREVAFTLVGVR